MSKKKKFQHSVTGKFPITAESILAMRASLVDEGADPNSTMTVGMVWVKTGSNYGHYAVTFEMAAPETAAERKARQDKATAKINVLAAAAGITVKVTT